MSTLEYPSLLPSVLLGDPEEAERRKRSTRDWVVDVTAFVVSVIGGGIFFAESLESDPGAVLALIDLVAGIVALVAIWWRRRWPVGVALLLLPIGTVSTLASVACLLALFTVAIHRPFRVLAVIGSLNVLSIPIYFLLRPDEDAPFLVSVVVVLIVIVAVIAWGMFVRARRQLVLSLRERAQRAEAEQALRVEQARRMERDRIAREMHDVLAHRISLVSLHAGALEYASASASPGEVAQAAEVIRSAAHQALEDLREVIGVLRADDMGNGAPERPQPTLADLDALLQESRAAGMRVRSVRVPAASAAVPESVGRSAYRVVQEGLTNARKHAPGCAVAVTVAGEAGDGLTVEVRNPLPVGGPVAAIPGAGTGIVGLGERVALAGGRLEHGPSDGEWHLRAWLPWPAA